MRWGAQLYKLVVCGGAVSTHSSSDNVTAKRNAKLDKAPSQRVDEERAKM